jgi:hypothetical protein
MKYNIKMYQTERGKTLWYYSGKANAEAKAEFFKGDVYRLESNETLVERLIKQLGEDVASNLTGRK